MAPYEWDFMVAMVGILITRKSKRPFSITPIGLYPFPKLWFLKSLYETYSPVGFFHNVKKWLMLIPVIRHIRHKIPIPEMPMLT